MAPSELALYPKRAAVSDDVPIVSVPVSGPASSPLIDHSVTVDVPVVLESLVVEVPSGVSSPQPVFLFDGVSGQMLSFDLDRGSFATLIRSDFASTLGLNVQPFSLTIPVPTQADGSTPVPIRGVVELLLEVPTTTTWLKVPTLVVDSLFCPCLLGRNVLHAMDDVYGNLFVYTSVGTPNLLSSERILAFLRESTLESLPVKAQRPFAVQQYSNSLLSRVEGVLSGYFVLPRALLADAAAIQGVFSPSPSNFGSNFKAGSALVEGRVCLEEPGASSDLVKVVFDIPLLGMLSPDCQSIDIKQDAALGTFCFGRPSVVANLSGDCFQNTDQQQQFVHTLLERSMLATPDDLLKAHGILSQFLMAEDLPAAGLFSTQLQIQLHKGTVPISRRNYPLSAADVAFAEGQIQAWLRNGTIVPSISPWASPILVVHHPQTKKPRLCVDYRGLNAKTIGDAYLMPLITDVSHALKGCSVFSKLDLVQGFGQLPVESQSQPLTAFRGVKGGLYQFAACPFGLRNVPAVFQRHMDTVLGSLNWKCASIYIDDCVVFSPSVVQHHRDLSALALLFRANRVFVRPSKCSFYVSEVEHLGFVFNGTSMRVLESRVEAILSYPTPQSREDLRRYLGLVGQFRPFMPKFAELAAPLERMKHKASKTPFDLSVGSPGFNAFHCIQTHLLDMIVCTIPDLNSPFHAYADASEHAISFILCQTQNGVERIISCYSKALDVSQIPWSIPVKEAFAVKHFVTGPCSQFLSSPGPHTIFVDSVAVGALTKATLQDPKLLRMAHDLSEYSLNIVPIKRVLNKSDLLSHPPCVIPDPRLVALAQRNPLVGKAGWPNPTVLPSSVAAITAPALPNFSVDVILAAQQADAATVGLVAFIRAGRPAGLDGFSFSAAAKQASVACRHMHVLHTGLLVRTLSLRGTTHTQYVIPALDSLRDALLQDAHAGPPNLQVRACRHGVGMFEYLQPNVWWSTLRTDCLAYAATCSICAVQKKLHQPPSGLLHSIVAERPGKVLSLDLVPMPKADGLVGFAMLTDKFSGLVTAVGYSKSPTAESALRLFDQLVNPLFCDVEQLYVDRDPVLTSNAFMNQLKKRSVEVIPAYAYHQQANFVERKVQDAKQLLRTTLHSMPIKLWPRVLADVVKYFNCAHSAPRGASPFEILTGWCPAGLVPYASSCDVAISGHVFSKREDLWDLVLLNLQKAQDSQSVAYNRLHEDRRFAVGDLVLLKSHAQTEGANFNLQSPYERSPWEVEAVLSEVDLLVRNFETEKTSKEVHVSDVRMAVVDVDPRQPNSEEHIVSRVHGHRRSRGHVQFLIEWEGFPHKQQFSWMSEADLQNVPLKDEYWNLVSRTF